MLRLLAIDPSDLTAVTILVAGSLVFVLIAARIKPRPQAIRGGRLHRLVLHHSLHLAGTSSFTAALLLLAHGQLTPTLTAAGQFAPVAWPRAALHGGCVDGLVVVCVAVVLAILLVGRVLVVAPPGSHRGMSQSLDRVARHTGRSERIVFLVYAEIAAGIEELTFRLAVPALLYAVTGHLLVSLVASIAMFAIAHYRQGWRGVLRTAVHGSYLMVLYLVTGQILYCILVHMAINMMAGLIYPELVVRARRSAAKSAVLAYRSSETARSVDI